MRKRRTRETRPSLFPVDPLPDFASTEHEIRRAVQRNAVQRGQFFALNLARLGIDQILDDVEAIARSYDSEEIREKAEELNIKPSALDILDGLLIPYPYYFCEPHKLVDHPELIVYYRNVAMVSAKVMRGIGLDTSSHEMGWPLLEDKANQLATYFNSTVSDLILANRTLVTGRRHLEMVFANLGESIGGSWRNEVGRLAYAEIIGSLLRYLHQNGCLDFVVYGLKVGRLDEQIEEDEAEQEANVADNFLKDSETFLDQLQQVERGRVVYKTVVLQNSIELRLNRQIIWVDNEGKPHRIGPDLAAIAANESLTWGGELKGGVDPAGSDEHWKTAKSAFDRILDAAENTSRPKPKLSFMATILVDRVAREAALWIEQGKLVSVYNLTQIAENSEKRQAFLKDLALFLSCEAMTLS